LGREEKRCLKRQQHDVTWITVDEIRRKNRIRWLLRWIVINTNMECAPAHTRKELTWKCRDKRQNAYGDRSRKNGVSTYVNHEIDNKVKCRQLLLHTATVNGSGTISVWNEYYASSAHTKQNTRFSHRCGDTVWRLNTASYLQQWYRGIVASTANCHYHDRLAAAEAFCYRCYQNRALRVIIQVVRNVIAVHKVTR